MMAYFEKYVNSFQLLIQEMKLDEKQSSKLQRIATVQIYDTVLFWTNYCLQLLLHCLTHFQIVA